MMCFLEINLLSIELVIIIVYARRKWFCIIMHCISSILAELREFSNQYVVC